MRRNLCVEKCFLEMFVPPELFVGTCNDFGRRRFVRHSAMTQRSCDVVRAAEIKRRLRERDFQQLDVALFVARHRWRYDIRRATGQHRYNFEASHLLHLVLSQRTNIVTFFFFYQFVEKETERKKRLRIEIGGKQTKQTIQRNRCDNH